MCASLRSEEWKTGKSHTHTPGRVQTWSLQNVMVLTQIKDSLTPDRWITAWHTVSLSLSPSHFQSHSHSLALISDLSSALLSQHVSCPSRLTHLSAVLTPGSQRTWQPFCAKLRLRSDFNNGEVEPRAFTGGSAVRVAWGKTKRKWDSMHLGCSSWTKDSHVNFKASNLNNVSHCAQIYRHKEKIPNEISF